VLLLAFSAGAVHGFVLYAAPIALLALPLVAGHYLGERSIERLAARRAAPRTRRAAAPAAVNASGPGRAFPRGGLLVAASLAERGPPRSVFVS